jgi:plasmid stabilization system protein ParE
MYTSVLLPAAKEDIREAALWYNSKQRGLGKRFTGEIREAVHYIKQNPKACSIRYNNVRTALVRIFPFIIHYITDEDTMSVTILAVLHTSRNPDLWEKREY